MLPASTVDRVFRDALAAVRARHGDIFPAATVELFAWRKFQKCWAGENEAHFVAEGQNYAEFLLVSEAILFELAKRSKRSKRVRKSK